MSFRAQQRSFRKTSVTNLKNSVEVCFVVVRKFTKSILYQSSGMSEHKEESCLDLYTGIHISGPDKSDTCTLVQSYLISSTCAERKT